jgi:hypothetical protein
MAFIACRQAVRLLFMLAWRYNKQLYSFEYFCVYHVQGVSGDCLRCLMELHSFVAMALL